MNYPCDRSALAGNASVADWLALNPRRPIPVSPQASLRVCVAQASTGTGAQQAQWRATHRPWTQGQAEVLIDRGPRSGDVGDILPGEDVPATAASPPSAAQDCRVHLILRAQAVAP